LALPKLLIAAIGYSLFSAKSDQKLSAAFVAIKEVPECSLSKSQQTRPNYRLIFICAFAGWEC
jgi:hypothetical protein